MTEIAQHWIGLMLAGPAQTPSLADRLRALGFRPHLLAGLDDAVQLRKPLALILVDEQAALGADLATPRKTAGRVLPPLLILLGPDSDAAPWLTAGFEDGLRLPITDLELSARLKLLARVPRSSPRRRSGSPIPGPSAAEQGRMEDELRKNDERFRGIFENSTIGIYCTTPDGRILMANPALIRMLRYGSFEELSRRNLEEEGIHAEYPRPWFRALLERDGRILGVEGPWRAADGSTVYVRESARVVRDEAGRILYYEGTVEDITDRRQAEEALRTLNAELERRVRERTEQLEASNRELEATSYSIAHDMRGPLRGINGFATLLMDEYAASLDDDGHEYIRRICSGARHLAEVMDGLLNLARLSRSEMAFETVDLGEMVEQILADLRIGDPTRKVEPHVSGDLLVRGDPRLLRVALRNLLDNAWKFTRGREVVRIEFSATQHEHQRAFVIRDNGVGFDKRYAQKLFGLFQRLHRQEEFEGTGIGLATVARIVHRHGGTVWADAQPDEGAAFYLTLGTDAQLSRSLDSPAP